MKLLLLLVVVVYSACHDGIDEKDSLQCEKCMEMMESLRKSVKTGEVNEATLKQQCEAYLFQIVCSVIESLGVYKIWLEKLKESDFDAKELCMKIPFMHGC